MKIIITISLWLAVWLAAPTARADAKDDFCESHQLGILSFEALDRDSKDNLISEAQESALGTALGYFVTAQGKARTPTGSRIQLAVALANAPGYHDRFCSGIGRSSMEYLARDRWNRLSKSAKCAYASDWDQIMERMVAWQDEIRRVYDFARAGDAIRRAMVELGCPGQ